MAHNAKPVTPYQHLLTDIVAFCLKLQNRHTRTMWTYTKDNILSNEWSLKSLYERVAAAKQLGYDVQLKTTDDGGLTVQYIKRAPEVPYRWRA